MADAAEGPTRLEGAPCRGLELAAEEPWQYGVSSLLEIKVHVVIFSS